MPVLRKREEIRSNLASQGGVIQSRPNPMVEMNRQNAAAMGRLAVDYGRTMALASEEEGRALARAAVFTTGPNGMPQMPPEITHRMGEIGARTYDNAMQERLVPQMRSALQAQISDAEAANLYDYDAFLEDANARIETMAAETPEGMEGMFQEAATDLIVGAGASIGMRMGQISVADARTRIPAQVTDLSDQIHEAVLAGDDALAQSLLIDGLSWLDDFGPAYLSDGDLANHRNHLLLETGTARLLRDAEIANEGPLTVDQLSSLSARLQTGQDPELMEYFTHEGVFTPSYEIARRAASRVQQLMGEANRIQGEQAEAARTGARAHILATGGADDTQENRNFADAYLGDRVGLTNPSGTRRAFELEDWASLSDQDRANAVTEIKNIGFLPTTAQQFFRAVARDQSPDMLEAGFLLYLDLRDAENSSGVAIDMTGELPQELQEIYGLVATLHGRGWVGQEGIMDAVELVHSVRDQEWDDEALLRRLVPDLEDFFSGGTFARGTVFSQLEAGNAQQALRDVVIPEVFAGIEATPDEKRQAMDLFTVYYRVGLGLEDAIEATRQGIEGRYTEAPGMNIARSAYHPSVHYPDAATSGVAEWLGRGFQAARAGAAGAAESLLELPFQVLPEDWEPSFDLGADRLSASTFDLMADVEIRNMVEAMPEGLDRDAFSVDRDMLVMGRDYTLIYNAGSGDMPTYNVMMPDAGGVPRMVGELDLRDEWQAAAEFNVNLQSVETLRTDREGAFLEETLGWDFYRLMREAMASQGQNFNPETFVQDLYEEYDADPEAFMAGLRG